MNKNVRSVLSGGEARGYAHIDATEEIEGHGYPKNKETRGNWANHHQGKTGFTYNQ